MFTSVWTFTSSLSSVTVKCLRFVLLFSIPTLNQTLLAKITIVISNIFSPQSFSPLLSKHSHQLHIIFYTRQTFLYIISYTESHWSTTPPDFEVSRRQASPHLLGFSSNISSIPESWSPGSVPRSPSSHCFGVLCLGCCVKCYSLSHVQPCDSMNYSPPGSSIHGILQARVLEWAAISFSMGSSPPRDRTQVSCIAAIREAWLFSKTHNLKCSPFMVTF